MTNSCPKVVAVVVTHNRIAKLRDTLDRLCAAPTVHLAHILVCDNASSDGTALWLAAHPDPRVVVVTNSVNTGGAGGFETAMRHATTRFDPDWLLLMDDDARPDLQTLATFNAVDRSTYDVWAAAVFYSDGTICDMNRPWVNPFGTCGAFFKTLLKGRDGFHLHPADYAGSPRPIDGASFVGLFVSRHAVRIAGYPDGRLFIYGDDVLYALAVSRAGGRIAFDPALRFEHDCETLHPDATLTPLWKVYYFHRNQILVYRAAAGRLWFPAVFALRRRQWHRRAAAYGAHAPVYRALLDLAIADGRAGALHRSHGEIVALSDARSP